MLRFASVSIVLGLGLLASVAVAGGALKSGPQVGENVPGPFHPLNVTGSAAGKKNCLYCANSGNPVAVVFAREVTPAVTTLLKKLDAATVKHTGDSMGSYAVFCSDAKGLKTQLEDLARKEKLERLVLSIDSPAGPGAYEISPKADVTVLLYNADAVVRANHAFAKGQLDNSAVDRVVADVSKIFAK